MQSVQSNEQELDFFEKTTPLRNCRGEHHRLELQESKGNGWLETVLIDNGPVVGMCDYQLKQPYIYNYNGSPSRLGFHLLLSGSFEITEATQNIYLPVQSRELWLRSGSGSSIHYTQPASRAIRGVSIELPLDMISAWLGGSPGNSGKPLEKLLKLSIQTQDQKYPSFSPISRSFNDSILQGASRLLATPRTTICGELQFESLILDLLAQILSSDSRSEHETFKSTTDTRRRAAVDEAIDILYKEWLQPPTIAALARRVGQNECYLKSWFRQQTGMSVGTFVRKLRMEKALDLIESRKYSVLQTALSVGYSNPSHFSQAFKQFHGRLPSYYTTKT